MPIAGSLDNVNVANNQSYWQNRTYAEETATVGNFTTVLSNGNKIEVGRFRRLPVLPTEP